MHAGVRGPPKQTQRATSRTVDAEVADGVTKTVEAAGKRGDVVADRDEIRDTTDVDVAAEGEFTSQCSAYALQGGGVGDDRIGICIDGQETRAATRRGAVDQEEIDAALEGAIGVEADIDVAAGAGGHGQASVVGGHHRVDVDVALGGEGERVGAPGHGVIDMDVAVPAPRAHGGGGDFEVAPGQRRADVCAGHVAPGRGDGEVVRVDQPLAVPALWRQSRNTRVAADLHPPRRGFDKAAVATEFAAAGRDCAVDFRHALVIGQIGDQERRPASADFPWSGIDINAAGMGDAVARHQTDRAAVIDQPCRLQAAGIFDDASLQAIGRLRGEDDQSAGGLHGIAVLDQRRDGGRFDANAGHPTIVELQFEHFTGGQRHRAALGDDHAVVPHLGRQQGDVAVQVGRDVPFVDDAAGGAVTREPQVAGHEVIIADAVRRRRQGADVHAGALAEVDAAGVGEEDLAVGIDAAKDLARVRVEHAVQGGRAAGRLDEVDRGLAADVERAPVDDAALTRLIDVHRRAGLRNVGGTGHDLAAGWQSVGGRRSLRKSRR